MIFFMSFYIWNPTTHPVDSKYTNKSAYKDTTNKKYYKFSGWNKSGEFNITSNTSISGSWDNGTDAPSMVDFDSLSVGGTFFLGKYQVESEDPWDIEWEIVHQTDNYQIARTKYVIDFRVFDAREKIKGTHTNNMRYIYGNNNWSVSNIKQFLNSDQASWYSAQHTYDTPPTSEYVEDYSNGITYSAYDTHKGFLYYWSDTEKNILKDYTFNLANPIVDGGGSYTWTGKVWLATMTQMYGSQNENISEGEQFTKFKTQEGRNITIHEKCIENNEYAKLKEYTTSSWSPNYWLSSADIETDTDHPDNPIIGVDTVHFIRCDGYIQKGVYSAGRTTLGIVPYICLPKSGGMVLRQILIM